MACTHSPEELLPVFEGTAVARPGHELCSLCGTVLYLVQARLVAAD